MDEYYMRLALTLAKNSAGRTSPNPMVGAVIVRNGEIVGCGWHKRAGTPHAEIHALNQAGNLAAGATMYVTLEPCCHRGRTGPCADAIIQSGIKKVVVAMQDPNPLVAGCGLTRLKEAGLDVVENVLAEDAARLNEAFIKWISTKMPFVFLKTAMTLDGKIATVNGHSQWISGQQARRRVHEMRNLCDGILVGIGTVLADNPQLTTRLPLGGKNPTRIVVDSMARTPVTAKVIQDGQSPTLIAVGPEAPSERINEIIRKGKNVEILRVPYGPDGLDLRNLLRQLGEREITNIMIEGGAKINFSALKANVVDKVYWFISPKIVGGSNAPGPVGGQGIASLDDAHLLEDINVESIGDDILVSAYLRNREGRDVYRTCGRIG